MSKELQFHATIHPCFPSTIVNRLPSARVFQRLKLSHGASGVEATKKEVATEQCSRRARQNKAVSNPIHSSLRSPHQLKKTRSRHRVEIIININILKASLAFYLILHDATLNYIYLGDSQHSFTPLADSLLST